MLGFSALLVLFAYSPLYWPAVALLLVAGVLNSLFGTSIATLIQTSSPRELRGRAMSVYTVTIIGIPSLGAMGTATAATVLGVRNAVGLGAALLGALALALLLGGGRLRDAR